MIPSTVFTGAWLASASDRDRYATAFAAEQERMRDVNTDARAKGLPIAEPDPVLYCAKLFAGLIENVPVWLRPPDVGQLEDNHFGDLLNRDGARSPGALFVATGGTSGGLRFARHSWASLHAAALGLHDRIGHEPIRSWCCLPLRHVAGLMQVVRAVISEGDVQFGEYRDLTKSTFSRKLVENRFVSLVPTQLARLLDCAEARENLRATRAVFVGGGPLSEELAERSRAERLPIAPTYGTTETGGMVTLMSPEAFLSGRKGVGSVLSGSEVVCRENDTLRIRANGLCFGYHDRDFQKDAWFETEDEGFWDDHGSLHVKGRRDRLVNTGGLKIDPAPIEQAIRDTGLAENCLVTGIPDPDWGERLIAFCTPSTVDGIAVKQALSSKLDSTHVPKLVLSVDQLPCDELGKADADAINASVTN
jgi:o-succinylbenzoate---CoA ligase